MHDRKTCRTVSWTVLLFLTAIFGVNGCGDLGNKTAPNDTPIANAGRDQGSIRPGMLVTLNGSASSDPDGQPLTYSWSFVSRPPGSTAVLTNPTRVSPTFTPDLAGDYEVRLIVNDGSVNSAPDTVLITSNNVPPVADAGPDQGGIVPGTVVTLNGGLSSDNDIPPDPLTYNWSFVSRPPGSNAVLTGSTTVTPTFTVDRAGDYVVQLIVRDGIVNSDPDSVTISTVNVAPVANAGPDQTVGPGLVTLNGSGSSDANGDPLTYLWSLSRPAGSAAVLSSTTSVSPTFTVDLAGDYVAQLIVRDGTVNSAPDSVIITTNNVAPVANAGPDQGGIALGTLVTLNGSGSSDANGDPLTYSWSLSPPAGSAAVLSSTTSVSPTFTVDLAGSYVAQLIVNDGTVNSAPDSVIITTSNVAPVANAGPDQGGIAPGTLVTLNGNGSSDANGDPLTYSWSLSPPAGSAAVLSSTTSISTTFTVDRAGDYVAQLIVNDGTVNSNPDSVMITTINVAPEANAGPDQTVGPGLVTLDGSGSSDANDDPITYSWTLVTKPALSLAVLLNPTDVSPTFLLDLPGEYVVELIVSDGTVDSTPDSVTITTN